MYLDFKVKMNDIIGNTTQTVTGKNGTVYVYLEISRKYDAAKKQSKPLRKCIGKIDPDNHDMLIPNDKFLVYQPDYFVPDADSSDYRSVCLKIGAHVLVSTVFNRLGLTSILDELFDEREKILIRDLVTYSVVTEGHSTLPYIPYAYDHPSEEPDMRICSYGDLSMFFANITAEQIETFFDLWKKSYDHQDMIYLFSRDMDSDDDMTKKVAIAYEGSGLPLYYESYSTALSNHNQYCYLNSMAHYRGYDNVCFVFNNGTEQQLSLLEELGCDFLTHYRAYDDSIKGTIKKYLNDVEAKSRNHIKKYDAYGITVEEESKYIHIYHKINKKALVAFEEKLAAVERALHLEAGQMISCLSDDEFVTNYFTIDYDPQDPSVFSVTRKEDAIMERKALSHYFVLVSSKKMNATQALTIYNCQDEHERVMIKDKCFLDKNSISYSSELFIEYLALIVRQKIHSVLQKENGSKKKGSQPMSVQQVIQQLDKIILMEGQDGIYRLHHELTRKQKEILNLFGMDQRDIRLSANDMSFRLNEVKLRNLIKKEN